MFSEDILLLVDFLSRWFLIRSFGRLRFLSRRLLHWTLLRNGRRLLLGAGSFLRCRFLSFLCGLHAGLSFGWDLFDGWLVCCFGWLLDGWLVWFFGWLLDGWLFRRVFSLLGEPWPLSFASFPC